MKVALLLAASVGVSALGFAICTVGLVIIIVAVNQTYSMDN